jgi:hypothetical protein
MVVHVARVNHHRRVTQAVTVRGYNARSDCFELDHRFGAAAVVGEGVAV